MVCVRVKNKEQYDNFIDILNTNQTFVENVFVFDCDDKCLNIAIEKGKCVEYCWNSMKCYDDCSVIKNCKLRNQDILSFYEYTIKLRELKLERICL